MPRIFAQYLAIYNNKIGPKAPWISIVGSKFCQILIKSSKSCQFFLTCCQKWQNIAKSGHTDDEEKDESGNNGTETNHFFVGKRNLCMMGKCVGR